MMTTDPLVSIGLPVFNGEIYLRDALTSLLNQDYRNIELIISDNASTDATQLICQEFVNLDGRVKYYRNQQNMGAVWNFNRVFELASGEYFMWAAFDDLRDPQYVKKCLVTLIASPSAVLCCTDVDFIDEEGKAFKGTEQSYGIRPIGLTPRERLLAIARASYWYDHYGLIRSNTLKKIRPAQHVWGFDVVLLTELCLQGEVVNIPEKLFLYRVFNTKTQQDAAATLGASNNQNQTEVSWSNLSLEIIKGIWLSHLGMIGKLNLSLNFLLEFCVLNTPINAFIKSDTVHTAKRALNRNQYGLIVGLLIIAAVTLPVKYFKRLKISLKYRYGRLRYWCTRLNLVRAL